MMHYVTASIGEGTKHAARIAALRARYSLTLTVLTSWPVACPREWVPSLGKWNTDVLRFWFLGFVFVDIPACWIDTDAVLLEEPDGNADPRPFFAQVRGSPDDFVCGHHGASGSSFFRDLYGKAATENNLGRPWWYRYVRHANINILPSTSFTHKQGAV